jgi:hypothetical protein
MRRLSGSRDPRCSVSVHPRATSPRLDPDQTSGAQQVSIIEARRQTMDMITMFVLLAAMATVISLFNGITSMARGGDADARQSHKLMFRRVGWQALTAVFLLLGLLSQLK